MHKNTSAIIARAPREPPTAAGTTFLCEFPPIELAEVSTGSCVGKEAKFDWLAVKRVVVAERPLSVTVNSIHSMQ